MELLINDVTGDAVNYHFVRSTFQQAGIAAIVTNVLCHPSQLDEHCTRVIVDSDNLPHTMFSDWLTALCAGDVLQPTLVHGYKLDVQVVRILQQQKVFVCRSLTPLGLITLAYATAQCSIPSPTVAMTQS